MEPTTNSDAAAVATLLGSWELLRDPNATPERLALIVREAPSKRNPAGYAAAAIRGAWNPPKSATSESAISREQRRGALAEFDGMSAAD